MLFELKSVADLVIFLLFFWERQLAIGFFSPWGKGDWRKANGFSTNNFLVRNDQEKYYLAMKTG